jgi:putative ABC transport system ATP-binding protein
MLMPAAQDAVRSATTHAPLLSCVDVHKSYTLAGMRVQALRGVDMRLEEPGFYAIMGQSGSGKSTLLHMLAALDRPDKGEITIAGSAVHAMSDREATLFRRTRIGIVFQQFNLIPTLTALENVELPGTLAKAPVPETRSRAMHLLDRLGLGARTHHRPDALSGGEQQRVAIARALLFSPGVLFADEPTGALDSQSSNTLWKLLQELAAEQRMLVLMVTHEPAAAAYCRRILVLQDGRVKGTIESEGLDAGGVATRYQQLVRAS